jgi:hypothetical protein
MPLGRAASAWSRLPSADPVASGESPRGRAQSGLGIQW